MDENDIKKNDRVLHPLLTRAIDIGNVQIIFGYHGRETTAVVTRDGELLGAGMVKLWKGDEYDLWTGEKQAVRKALAVGEIPPFPFFEAKASPYLDVYSAYRLNHKNAMALRHKVDVPPGWQPMKDYRLGTRAIFLMRDNSLEIGTYEITEDVYFRPDPNDLTYRTIALGWKSVDDE